MEKQEPKVPQKKDDIPYVTRILNEKLVFEQKSLDIWNKNLKSSDALVVRQANGNINSCQERIEQLTQAIEFLKLFVAPPKTKKA